LNAIGVALGTLAFLVGLFWLILSIAHDSRWAQSYVRWSDGQARAWGERGYKVNVSGFYAWVARSRVRAAAFAVFSIAFGVWFVSLFR
jgi:hypothetical protein